MNASEELSRNVAGFLERRQSALEISLRNELMALQFVNGLLQRSQAFTILSLGIFAGTLDIMFGFLFVLRLLPRRFDGRILFFLKLSFASARIPRALARRLRCVH